MWWAFRIGALVLVAATFPLWWPWVRSLPASLRARSVGGVARAGLALGVLGFVALQWVPYGWDHSNPPVLAEPAWQGEGTRALVVRGCYACHSNETEWAWHTNIAPGSWLAWRDVTSGRDALNFSEWVPGTEALEDYADEATEAVEEVEDGDMPPWRYTIVHPEARFSAEEEAQLLEGLRATFGDRRSD